MRQIPVCDACGVEIDPRRFEDCDTYYLSHGRALCRDCFLQEEREFLELCTDQYAALVGATVVEVT